MAAKSSPKPKSKVAGITTGKSSKSSSAAALKTPEKKVAAAKPSAKPVASKAAAKPASSLDFIGTFPIRKNGGDKKSDLKKQPTGPVFQPGTYTVTFRASPLSKAMFDEAKSIFLGKHVRDVWKAVETQPVSLDRAERIRNGIKDLEELLISKKADMVILNLKDIPLEPTKGVVLAASMRREDARDALVTRSTFGAIQELPRAARIGATSRRRIMQIKNMRPDLQIIQLLGGVKARLEALEKGEVDAVLVAWSGLRRLGIAPRYYVSLQSDLMTPAPCQGIIGVLTREEDTDLIQKLHYVEDSEASWASRCERAFLQKICGGVPDAPVGAYAHRKGTQDPWILDSVIGDPNTGELLKHREIGTSRCKPESLADKAFAGILAKGARKFMPVQFTF